ncbi:exodeoxyribonuclease VII small subunit [Thorsellia anophelis]|uniref:Exodeoxyribonuclease 7 small subunit n=1 Tax=Thorsellia anophelis DSM 18579 TaxID=1123402 RepID=A0A1H9YF08_9GAMM|nr:exodeoxyribonuclease VII small subunit [Thorsellia anophelis]SES67595.1 Exodeoxyribonuclease VII small subunit [Thorsellia anophelis DSM 18579]
MPTQSEVQKSENLSFEDAMKALESIVVKLETGELPLEESLKEFERGISLARQSQKTLEAAEQRVKILLNPDENSQLTDF